MKHLKTRSQKRLVFKWIRFSNGRISDPYCITLDYVIDNWVELLWDHLSGQVTWDIRYDKGIISYDPRNLH